ncbi:hypothetical protein BD560DRAFT_387455 [Blakeslea trispora]|nr:hypothetical protein BD560DRAFT_387455 [Blakeslea trispora]
MDLSWCIMCDSRIPDEMTMANSSLYCSQECRLKDEHGHTTTTTKAEQMKPPILKSWMTKKSTAKHHFYRTNAPSTVYPWVPNHRKRRGSAVLQARRCSQPNALYPTTNLIR